ncbi:MAG: signal peptidase I [Alphaproteobacteria bacterium]|nr:signal peptidase I [Alphaproteobacteria bacterium]
MSEKPSLASRLADEARAFLRAGLVFLPIWIVFNTVGWAQYSIPSESMSPTLEVGDRVLVTKWAYGYSRFSAPIVWRFMPPGEGRVFASEPRRGDVVVFAHPRDGRTMIKRLIGLPGDVIAMQGGKLVVNGEAASYVRVREVVRLPPSEKSLFRAYNAEEQAETIGGREHLTLDIDPASPGDQWGPMVVPEGHFLFMGDNRDNSDDSRFPDMGFVSYERLIGRAETVIFAPRGCAASPEVSCFRSRFLKPLAREVGTVGAPS